MFIKKFQKILECEKYGKVNEIFMTRKDIEENDVAGMENAYVLFDSVDDAKNARRNLCCRRFNDRLVRIIYCEEEKFDKKNFEDNEESNNNIEGNNEKNKITFCTKVLCFKGLVKNIDIEKEDVYK